MSSHHQVMTRPDRPKKLTSHVGVAELKARLSECLREVRRGHSLTVLDRQQPIARLVPIEASAISLTVRAPQRKLHDVPLPPAGEGRRPGPSLAALLEERQGNR